ncbi:hypothetical protein FACS189445_3500 [Spirochaetia bacterium]|nr:hypothetical protein FACS189445_3500 [Spirochaetia bacterium]
MVKDRITIRHLILSKVYAILCNMEIYMDCCCLNRPFDDQTQDKIRIESDTIMAILWKCFYGKWLLIGSDIVTYEIMKTPDLGKRNKVLNVYSIKKDDVSFNDEIQNRALGLQKYGLKALDSLHFASAEYKNVSVLFASGFNTPPFRAFLPAHYWTMGVLNPHKIHTLQNQHTSSL